MRVVRRKSKLKWLIIMIIIMMIIVFVNSIIMKAIEPSLQAFARQKVSTALNNIAKEVLKDMDFDYEKLYQIHRNSQGDITDVNFDSQELNQLLYTSLNTIDDALEAASDGVADPITQEVFYVDGIVYRVPLGYFTKIFWLYNLGPKINVRMQMINDVNGDLKTDIIPYGQNAAMIKITLLLKMDANAITFLSSEAISNECELPLVIQIVHGEVSNFSSALENN